MTEKIMYFSPLGLILCSDIITFAVCRLDSYSDFIQQRKIIQFPNKTNILTLPKCAYPP